MGRIVQPKGTKGSLKWIQNVINSCPDVLNRPIIQLIDGGEAHPIEWLSPRADDDYAEYRDQAFLDLLGIKLSERKLQDFWPRRGPQWDALGHIEGKAYFLVEAKAHVSEIISSSQAQSPASKALIEKSLNETKSFLNLKPYVDLTRGLYQYANRLAHLYFLRELNDVPAYLVFAYFLNDHTHISTTRDEWNGALHLMHAILGTHKHRLSEHIIDVFVDVEKLGNSDSFRRFQETRRRPQKPTMGIEMRLLDSMPVYHNSDAHVIELCHGDLTEMGTLGDAL